MTKDARALFDRHSRLVMSYCLLSTGYDRDRAKDLTQETFARAFAKLHTLEDEERFVPWVMTIAKNVCRTTARSRARYQEVLAQAAVEMELDLRSNDEAERQERIQAVQNVLASISDDRLKEIVMLRYREPPHTTRQIAEKLGVPHGTITVTLMRFRASIRKRMLRALLELEGATP